MNSKKIYICRTKTYHLLTGARISSLVVVFKTGISDQAW